MPEECHESELSRRMKSKLEKMISKGIIGKNSVEYNAVKKLKFDKDLYEDVLTNGKIDSKKVYEIFSKCDEPMYSLMKICVKLNFNDLQIHDIIKFRFTKNYGPDDYFFKKSPEGNRYIAKKQYPKWCKEFGINPDKDFPDW